MATKDFKPTEFKVLSFDVYGTLVDWETSIFEQLSELAKKSGSSSSSSLDRRSIMAAFAAEEKRLQADEPDMPYPELLAHIYSALAQEWGVELALTDSANFGSSVGKWAAFSDTRDALGRLSKHYKLVVLSNVDNASFTLTSADALAGVPWAAVYTAQDIGSYKPDARNFAHLVDHAATDLGVDKAEIWHVANSLFHDHLPAKAAGLRPGVWISRKSVADEGALLTGPVEELMSQVALAGEFDSLKDFADAVDTAF